MSYRGGWDDGYMERYPTEQYGHGVRNTVSKEPLYQVLPSDIAIANQRVNTPPGMVAKASRIGNDIFYDSGSISEGFRSFVRGAPDNSMKGVIYEYGTNTDMLKEMNRALEKKGALVSGGANLQFDIGDSITGILGALKYPLETIGKEGLGAGITLITSPLANVFNTLTKTVGLGESYYSKGDVYSSGGDPSKYRTITGSVINAGLYGAVGVGLGSIAPNRTIGRLVGGLVGIGVGLLQPTYTDSSGWGKVGVQIGYLERSATAYSDHIAQTGGDPYTDVGVPLAVSTLSSIAIGAGIGRVVGKTGAGALIGAAVGAASTAMYSMLRYQDPVLKLSNMGTGGVRTADKVSSVLTGEKYIPGQQGLTHIHSKALWTKDEVFISTGNLQTVWQGGEKQFNLAVKIGGEQGKAIASQLDKVHTFLKTVTRSSDLSALEKQTPDLILGGKGSKSKEKIVSFLKESKGDVWISAPYVSNSKESRLIIDTIKDLEKKGHNVHILAQNPSGMNAGGNASSSKQVLAELKAAGVQIYMTPQGSDTLEHAKLIADEDRVLLTSHNLLSGNSINNVIEVGTILRGKEYADATRDAITRRLSGVGAKELDGNRYLNPDIYDSAKRQSLPKGSSIPQGFIALQGPGMGMLLPASMGGSYFYARGQYNALMRQAGLTENIITNDDASVATSMYQVGYLAKHGRNASSLPQDVGSTVVAGALVGTLMGGLSGRVGGALIGTLVGGLLGAGVGLTTSYVTQYDKELTGGGLGAAINEWGASNDWGRLYKDEVGFIPSIAGLIGRVLDRTYLYASPSGALWADKDDGQVIGKGGLSYPGESKGFFETFLSKGTEIAIGAASSVALYLAIGEPINILLGEMMKGEVESLINVGASPDTFRKGMVQGIFARQLTTGMGIGATNVTEYREELLREISSTTRADYEGLEKARSMVDYLSVERKGVVGSQVMVKHDPRTTKGKALLESAMADLQRMEGAYGMKGFYSLDRMGASVYHISTLTRERSGTLMENTLKPFILEHIDPYTEGSEGARELRKGLGNVVNEMKRPAFLDVELNDSSSRALAFIRDVEERSQVLLQANPRISNAWQQARADVVLTGKYAKVDDDIANVTFRLKNAGKDRASRVASVIQEVLDLVPLPITQFRAVSKHFGGGVESSKDIKVLGDIFSFDEVTNSIGRALQGTGGLSEYLAEYKALSNTLGPDLGVLNAITEGPGRILQHIQERREVVKSLEASSVAISKMERSLFASGNIRWGHEIPADMLQRVEDEVVQGMKAMNPALDAASTKVQAEIYRATQVKLGPLVDPLVREITLIDDVMLDVLKIPGARGEVGSKAMSIIGETLRTRQHASYMSGVTKKKLDRVRAGWGKDATSGVTKGKLGTAAISIIALSLFAEKLVRTTDGVSVFTQLTTALSLRAEGIQVSSEFKGDALLPTVAGMPLDYLLAAGLFVPAHYIASAKQGQRILTYAMRRDTVAKALNITASELSGAISGAVPHPKVTSFNGGMVGVELFPNTSRVVLHMSGVEDDFMRMSFAALEGNKWRNTAAAWALSLVAMTVLTKGIAGAMNTSRSMTSSGTLDSTVLGSLGAVAAGSILGRTMGGKGIVLGTIVGAVVGAAIGTVTSSMREGREGTLDPIALGLVGVGVGKAVGGKGRRGLAGALIGGGLGLVAGMFTSFLKVGRDDWEKVNKKEGTILADMTTYVKRVKDRAKAGDASRLELMGAYYAMGWMKTLRGKEQEAGYVRGGTQVIAKQSVLPNLQMFMAESIKGATYNEDGSMKTMGTSYYSVGIQGPIVTGISIPIPLPFKVTRDARGTIGLALNEDPNVGTFMGDFSAIRTAILTTLTGLGLITGTANLVQAGIRSLVTRTPFMKNMLDGGWDKGIRGVVTALTDTALILPSSALRISMSMTSVDYIVAGKAFMPKVMPAIQSPSSIAQGMLQTPTTISTRSALTDPSFYGRHIGRALIWGVLGAAAGSALGAVMSSSPTDPYASQVGSTAGGVIGAVAGSGLYMAAALTKESRLGAGIISRMGRPRIPLPNTLKKVIGRGAGVLALMATLGTLFTSSTFGIAIGMDKPPSWSGYQEKGNAAFNAESTRKLEGEYFPSWVPILGYKAPTNATGATPNLEAGGWTYQRAMTVAMYATVSTAAMTMYGGMGKSAGDTVDEYMRLVRRKRPAPTDNIMAQARESILQWKASHLEKDIDTILRRGHDIGGDALAGNLQEYHNASKVLYDNKVRKAVDITPNMSQEVEAALDTVVSKGRGIGVSLKLLPDLLPRRALKGATLLGAVALGVGLVTASMGKDSMDRLYDHLDGGNSLMRSIGDTVRLFTGTDRSINEESLLAKQYVKEGGGINLLTNRKMLKGSKELGATASSLWKQMSELIVFDAPNAFVGVQVLGGVTLRRGEFGDRVTPYLQIQGAGADLSTATYSMSASFLFNSIGTSQDLHFNMVNAMRELQTLTKENVPITQAHLRRASIGILSYTAKMQPLAKPRKYSVPSSGALSAAAKDPLIALALSHRQAVTRQMAYQPPESLISAMLKEDMNPAYNGMDSSLMGAILTGSKLISSTFGNMMREIRIHGIKAFSVSKNGLRDDTLPLAQGEWIEDEAATGITGKTSLTDSPLWTPARMLLGVLPTPIAYTVGITAVGTLGMFAAASVGGFFLNREVNAIEEALDKHYSRDWFLRRKVGEYEIYPHRVARVVSPAGTQLTPHNLYTISEGKHGTMYSVNPHLTGNVTTRGVAQSAVILPPAKVHQIVEIAQDAINSSLKTNGVLFGDYMRTQPYLQQVTNAVTNVHGKPMRVSTLVDEISSPVLDVVDRYFTALDNTSLVSKVLVGKDVVEYKVPFLSIFTNAPIEEIVANPKSWGSAYGEGFQASIANRFADGMHPYNTVLTPTGVKLLDPIGTYKDEIREVIREVVESELHQSGSLLKLNKGTVKTDEDGILHLVQRALDKLRDKGGPLGKMRHEWAGMATPLPLDVADRFEELLGESIDMGHNATPHATSQPGRRMGPGVSSTPRGIGGGMSDAEWRARRAKPTNWGKVQKGAGVLTETLLSVFSIFEATDIWGAFGRAAEAYAPGSTYTTGEQKELAQEAGYVGAMSLLSAGVMAGVMMVGGKVVAGIGAMVGLAGALITGTVGLTFGSAAALVGAGLLAIGAVGAATYGLVNLLAPQGIKDSVNGWVSDTSTTIGKGLGGVGTAIATGVKAAAKGVSNVFDWSVNTLANTVDTLGKKTGATGVAMLGGAIGGIALGGAVASLSYVAGSGLVMAAGAGVAGVLGLGASAAAVAGGAVVAGGIAITSALVMGLWATLDPKGMQRVWSKLTSTLSTATKDVPMIGEGFLATKRGTWLQGYTNPMGSDSPFFVGTAQQAIEWEFQKTIELNMDYTGDKVASSIIDPSLYGYSPTAPTNSALRPDSVVDNMISSEIKLRGQLHNQTIIGQYIWRSVLSSASNKEVILKEERRHIQASYDRVVAIMAPSTVTGTTLSIREQVDMKAVATLTASIKKAISDGTPKGVTLKVNLPAAHLSSMQAPASAPLMVDKARSTTHQKVVVKKTYSPLNVYFMDVVTQAVVYPGHSALT